MSHDQPFITHCSATDVSALERWSCRPSGHKDYDGLLETCVYYRLGQGEVENVSEHTCQLVSTFSKYVDW